MTSVLNKKISYYMWNMYANTKDNTILILKCHIYKEHGVNDQGENQALMVSCSTMHSNTPVSSEE